MRIITYSIVKGVARGRDIHAKRPLKTDGGNVGVVRNYKKQLSNRKRGSANIYGQKIVLINIDSSIQ